MTKNAGKFQKDMNLILIEGLLEELKKNRYAKFDIDYEDHHIKVFYKHEIQFSVKVFQKYFLELGYDDYGYCDREDKYFFDCPWDIEMFEKSMSFQIEFFTAM